MTIKNAFIASLAALGTLGIPSTPARAQNVKESIATVRDMDTGKALLSSEVNVAISGGTGAPSVKLISCATEAAQKNTVNGAKLHTTKGAIYATKWVNFKNETGSGTNTYGLSVRPQGSKTTFIYTDAGALKNDNGATATMFIAVMDNQPPYKAAGYFGVKEGAKVTVAQHQNAEDKVRGAIKNTRACLATMQP